MNDPLLLRVLDEAQARQLPTLIAEWAEAGDERRWIARALRIDLALLTARPELVVPCLYRRCATVGDHAAEWAMFRFRPLVAGEVGRLHAWMRDAAASWGAGRTWLRALRTPRVPLDGAVIEEYRTSVRGALWCSDDGERIGVAGDDGAITWDRATGRRIDGARAQPLATPQLEPWAVAWRDSSWGRLVLERGDRRIAIDHSDDEIVRSVKTLSERHVLIGGDDMDMDDFHGVVDARTSTIAWRAAGACASTIVVDDERVMLARAGAVETVAIATGERLARWECPYPGEMVVAPDGKVAIRVGDVVRVWDVAAAGRPQVQPTDDNSWTPVAFSPDGTRLVTGYLLCDARTGAAIDRMTWNGPRGWLEGGPPRGCQRLCDGVFAEIMPFGFTLWDTRGGKQLASDRERRARHGDAVAFDPSGRYHALWEERGRLLVYAMREGTLLHELEQPTPVRGHARRIEFTQRGELLVWDRPGVTWALAMRPGAEPQQVAAEEVAREPEPTTFTVEDGVLVVGDAAIPCDEARVVASPDGRVLASTDSHYRLER